MMIYCDCNRRVYGKPSLHKVGLMYKDMKPGKEYTTEELGLWEE